MGEERVETAENLCSSTDGVWLLRDAGPQSKLSVVSMVDMNFSDLACI